MKDLSKLKVAIVCDWLIGGGAERVVLELHHMFPEAPIYTSYATDDWDRQMDGKVITGYLQHWPFSKLRKFIPPLRAHYFSHLKLRGYDLVISSSGAEAKGIRAPNGTLHISYCHSPTHYYWVRYDEYIKQPGFGPFNWLARLGLKLLVGPMRRWDFKAAQRPDLLIANSSFTQNNIKKYYHRDSTVIHPPVDIKRFEAQKPQNRHGFVVAGRQTPYKRIDLAVAACSQLGLDLTVIGNGPDHNRLTAMGGPNITFLTNLSDSDMPRYFQSAEAFIFPGMDDFGIVAVEAMAAGAPVIAYKAGGAPDYVVPGKTGVFFDEQAINSLVKRLQNFRPTNFDNVAITRAAQSFDTKEFHVNITSFISKNMIL